MACRRPAPSRCRRSRRARPDGRRHRMDRSERQHQPGHAQVTVMVDGAAQPVTVTQLGNNYGAKYAIRFNPMGWTTAAGKTYAVSVTGIPTATLHGSGRELPVGPFQKVLRSPERGHGRGRRSWTWSWTRDVVAVVLLDAPAAFSGVVRPVDSFKCTTATTSASTTTSRSTTTSTSTSTSTSTESGETLVPSRPQRQLVQPRRRRLPGALGDVVGKRKRRRCRRPTDGRSPRCRARAGRGSRGRGGGDAAAVDGIAAAVEDRHLDPAVVGGGSRCTR